MPRKRKTEVEGEEPKKKRKPAFVREVVLEFYRDNGIHFEPEEIKFHEDRKWRFDFGNLEYKIALEIEGGVFTYGGHSRGRGMVEDMEKYNEAMTQGWMLFRVIPSQCCMEEILDQVKRGFEFRKNNPLHSPSLSIS